MIVKDRPQASQRPTVTLKTAKDVSLACIMYNTLPNVFRLQRRALSICYPIFLGDRMKVTMELVFSINRDGCLVATLSTMGAKMVVL